MLGGAYKVGYNDEYERFWMKGPEDGEYVLKVGFDPRSIYCETHDFEVALLRNPYDIKFR